MKLRWYQVQYIKRYYDRKYVYVEARNKDVAEFVARQWVGEWGKASRRAVYTVTPWSDEIPEGADRISEKDYPQLEGMM